LALLLFSCEKAPCEHEFGEWETVKEATCSEEGLQRRVCLLCTYSEENAVKRKEHEIVSGPFIEPRCTADGLVPGKYCAICGFVAEEQKIIPARGHVPEPLDASEPTCTGTGLTKGSRCAVCGEIIEKQQTVPAKGHTEGGWIIDREPTLFSHGEKHRVCAVCGDTIAVERIKCLGKYDPVLSDEEKAVALTFDDGPHYTNTKKLLDIIEEKGVRVTFFVQGVNMDASVDKNDKPVGTPKIKAWAKEYMQRAADLGCEYGNHSYDHPDFNKLSNVEASGQIERTSKLISQALGDVPILFRAPYGNIDEKEELVSSLGYGIIRWSVDSADYSYAAKYRKGTITREECVSQTVERVMKQIGSGGIILMHDIHPTTIDAAPLVIDRLLEEGYRLVTVSELCDLRSREPDGTVICERATVFAS